MEHALCASLPEQSVHDYVRNNGRRKCQEYGIECQPAGGAGGIGADGNEAQIVAMAIGLDDPPEYPARRTLAAAAQQAVEERTGDERAGCIRVSADGSVEVDMCNECHMGLARGEVPANSYARVDNGPRPSHLPQLTLLEERVVSPARVLRHMMICRHIREQGPADPALYHSKLRAHIISFNSPDAAEIAAMFPVRPEQLPELISVVLVAAAQSEADLIRIACDTPALHVRGRVIAQHARHLAALHPRLAPHLDEEARTINRERLAAAMLQLPAAERAPLCGLFQAHQYKAATQYLLARAARISLADVPGLEGMANYALKLERHLRYFHAEYAEWPLLAHPNRFPNGTGGQPAGMTEAHWVQLQLRRWYPPDDHSGQAPHFVLDMFDRLQRHQVNDWVTQHLQIHPHLVERLQNMTYDQVLQALELLALGLRGQELADRVRAAPPIVADLVRGVRMSTSKVAGTAASAGSLRSRAYGLWVLYGPPTLSLTLNPSSINAEQFYELCGAGYGFDADGKPVGRPAPGDHWQLAAGHPVSSAQCFDACMRAFFEIYAGWRFGDLDQANPNCLFGRVDAYVHKPETNQRGDLHAHPSLWQHAFHPTRLRPALAGWQRHAVLRFMESIQGQSFASPTLSGAVQPSDAHAPPQARPVRQGPPQPSSCACEQGRHRVHAECQHRPALAHLRDALQAVRRRVQDDAARTCQLPLSDADPDPERAALFAAEAALEVLVHDHLTGTCTPPGTPATDENCRLRHPRALNWESAVDPATGCVHLKRYGCTLVAHIVSFLLALPCNHTVTFACEVSRVLRTQELWDRKHPTLPKTHPSRPRLQRIEAMAAELADYALKYNTKAEASEGAAGQLAAVLLLKMQQRGILVHTGRHLSPTIAAVAEAAQPPPSTAQEVQEAAERAAIDEQRVAAERAHAAPHQGYHTAHFQLAHACNVSTAQTTLPAPMAALALLNGQVYRESYHSQYIDYRLFSSALLPGSAAGIPEAPPVGVEFVPSERDPSAAGPSQPLGVRIVTRHTDYLYRGPDLAHLSPMFLFMFYYKQTLLLWRSTDLSPAGGALSAEYLQELERLGGSENDGGVPAVCGFFHSVRYNMTTTVNPTLRHVHNNTATGTGIILDPREPAIPAGAAVHVLTYPPCAIIVKPDGLSPGHTLPHLQPGEIVVAPSIVDFTPSAARQPTAVTRYGFPLDAAYAVTDYYVQGASLHGFWLVHFGRPPTGGYHRASLYVIATRFRSLNDLHLLTPLWNNAHEEQQLKLAFRKLAQRDPDLAAEWERLTALAATTAAQYDALLSALPAEPPV
ncbi:hypothetical protein GPECTOR_454g356 [Gonium pectorale]|uniref:Uncharacterized protein n=1 Tax=Gonium pectorale TaxID=33097 RepID=A0A150FV32_GONPE|nr:hypothetical protein GPECTOR_454g356 [Gonium pectorale]|eukprot:KXZ41459.1 hypothetical protein GPECTOR_454g356 [Gonium pectorale]